MSASRLAGLVAVEDGGVEARGRTDHGGGHRARAGGEPEVLLGIRQRLADGDDRLDAGGLRAVEHRVAVGVELGSAQVRVSVDQPGRVPLIAGVAERRRPASVRLDSLLALLLELLERLAASRS